MPIYLVDRMEKNTANLDGASHAAEVVFEHDVLKRNVDGVDALAETRIIAGRLAEVQLPRTRRFLVLGAEEGLLLTSGRERDFEQPVRRRLRQGRASRPKERAWAARPKVPSSPSPLSAPIPFRRRN